MAPTENPGLARVEVTVAHSPLAFFYDLFMPPITISGQSHRRPWGTHFFEVPPGNHEISVSYPWLFSPECGKSTVRIALQPGETRRVTYTAGFVRYLPGKMTVH
jgi:hypothetical protein